MQSDTASVSGGTNMISLCNKFLQDIHSLNNLNHLPWDIKTFQQDMSVPVKMEKLTTIGEFAAGTP